MALRNVKNWSRYIRKSMIGKGRRSIQRDPVTVRREIGRMKKVIITKPDAIIISLMYLDITSSEGSLFFPQAVDEC